MRKKKKKRKKKIPTVTDQKPISFSFFPLSSL